MPEAPRRWQPTAAAAILKLQGAVAACTPPSIWWHGAHHSRWSCPHRCPSLRLRCRHTAATVSVPPASAVPASSADVAAAPATSSNGSGEAQSHAPAAALTFQEAVARLQQYWASVGCTVTLPFNSEVRPPLLQGVPHGSACLAMMSPADCTAACGCHLCTACCR